MDQTASELMETIRDSDALWESIGHKVDRLNSEYDAHAEITEDGFSIRGRNAFDGSPQMMNVLLGLFLLGCDVGRDKMLEDVVRELSGYEGMVPEEILPSLFAWLAKKTGEES